MQLRVLVFSVLFFQIGINIAKSARILAIIPTPAYSHQIAFHPLWKELSKKHEVVTVTTYMIEKDNSTNLTQIDLSSIQKNALNLEYVEEQLTKVQNNPIKIMEIAVKTMEVSVSYLLEHPYLNNIIKNPESEHFDVLIVEGLYPPIYALAELLHCPVIGAFSLDAPFYQHVAMGNPAHLLIYPDFMLPFGGDFTFKERIITVFFWLYMQYTHLYQFVPIFDQLLKTHLENTTASTLELESNIDLLLINTNPILHGNRPLGPKTVPFGGGSHITSTKPLPKDIDDFLTSAKEGVIYFSLGSNVKSKNIKPALRSIILETFKELPYKVLWKFEADELDGKPDNVKIVKWLPQPDILRHPNVKLFITQGGLQSTEESIYSNVPMVVLPFMSDQLSNAIRVANKGMGLYLDTETLTKENFKETILEVLENDKYRNTVRKLVELAKDQPMTGIEKAVWWIEYVIRHNGTQHLAYEGRHLPTYQYYFLDVIGFFLLILTAIIVSIVLIFKKIYKFFRKTKVEKIKLN